MTCDAYMGCLQIFPFDPLHSDLTDLRHYFNLHLPKMVMNCKLLLVCFMCFIEKVIKPQIEDGGGLDP